ncbi:MAG: hypothetical protein K2M19_05985 [Muribaculaceae bacterium]|nr:hypothetical protein [Muribaculaceae bacterium]
MASKRKLKKRIGTVCGDLAADMLLASHFENVNYDTVCKVVTDIASLQQETLAHVTFSFDKVAKDFANRAEYNRARNKYTSAAFRKLNEDFTKKATEIVKAMNLAIPADVRKAVTKLS